MRELVRVQQAEDGEYVPLLGSISLAGTGINGRDTLATLSIDQKIAKTWEMMMRRCYVVNDPSYHKYGAVGCFVSSEWQDLNLFTQSVKELHGWPSKMADWRGFALDKDYYGAKYYSSTSCVWLSIAENNAYTGIAVRVTDCFGVKRTFVSTAATARCLRAGDTSIRRYCTDKQAVAKSSRFKGWEFELIRNELWRYKI